MDLGIEFILVGRLAAVVQGAPITTMDIDIVHHQTAENIEKLVEIKRTSKDPKDKQRLPILEETLRRLKDE